MAFTSTTLSAAPAAPSTPVVYPDPATVAARKRERPGYVPLTVVNQDTDYLVLDIPLGRRFSRDLRQCAKSIGAVWHNQSKEWRISASRFNTSTAYTIVNDLCLVKSQVPVRSAFTARVASPAGCVFLDVPFDDRAMPKADGAKWSKRHKRWYFEVRPDCTVFSTLIAKYESRGWVAVEFTEAHSALNMVDGTMTSREDRQSFFDGYRPSDTATAEALPFVKRDRFGLIQVTENEKQFLDTLLRFGPVGSAEVIGQFHELTPATGKPEGVMRFLQLKGCGTVRISCGPETDGQPVAVAYSTAESCRPVWNTCVQDGWTVTQRLHCTLADTLGLVLYGRTGTVQFAGEIDGAMERIRLRHKGRIPQFRSQ